MRCIFCKTSSQGSRSVEHIIPEALGNTEHVLPRGVVCDRCNNYFAIKIEQPLLESIHFKNLRGRQQIVSKRGIIPPQRALFPALRIPLDLYLDDEGMSVSAARGRDERAFIKHLLSTTSGTMYLLNSWPFSSELMSRFLAKIAIEVLAQRLFHVHDWEEALIDDPQLDPLRRFARVGDKPALWPFHHRRIYEENALVSDGGQEWQIVHEYDLLYTEERELYCVVCFFGEEFVINMGEPQIESYERWLARHSNHSPLYSKGDRLPVSSQQAT
jgi:hypothetical protein